MPRYHVNVSYSLIVSAKSMEEAVVNMPKPYGGFDSETNQPLPPPKVTSMEIKEV